MIDLDEGILRLTFSLADSAYRYYAAFGFAELLASKHDEFLPLLEFARAVPDLRQPAPATCSMGVRVLVETADQKLVVAYRSDQVKMNPEVWSVSANEGVRRSLLKEGRDCSNLLTLAVYQALSHELRIAETECQQPVLLSIYRNQFNQWGASFAISTDLDSTEVMARQSSAPHRFEHRQLAAIPLEPEACGRAMLSLGERWYGGALESICQFLAWRELASRRFWSPEEVGAILSKSAGGVIKPVDQANATVLSADP
jgi:hypothetical protein